MNRLTNVTGLAALACVAVGLNIAVLTQNPFSVAAMTLLGLGILAGGVWIALVLWATARHSRHEGRALYGLSTVLGSIVFLGICVVVYAFAAHTDKAWDLTQEGRRQLAPQTIQVLENLSKDVSVIGFFLQIDDELVKIAQEKTVRFLEMCQRHTPHLKVEILDPQIDRPRLEGLGITHASTQGTIVIRCGTRQKVVTLGGASPRLEEREFTNSLINVVRDAQPKVCFLSGHGERSIEDENESTGGSGLKLLLEGEAYTTERVAIRITQPEVPADCDVLVVNGVAVSGPQSDLHPEEIRAIQEYLDRGGRMLVMIDPWARVRQGGLQQDQFLPWLHRNFGIVVGEDMVVSPETGWSVELTPNTSAFPPMGPDDEFRASFSQRHSITTDSDQPMVFAVARSVRLEPKLPDGVVGSELLRTPPSFYAETDVVALKETGKAYKSPDEADGPVPVAVAVTTKTDFQVGDTGQTRDARIVVVGDSDFASNAQLTVVPGNLNFILNAMAWLSENEELIAIRSTGKQDAPVLLTAADRRVVVYAAVLGTLQAVIVVGFIVYLKRRRYQ